MLALIHLMNCNHLQSFYKNNTWACKTQCFTKTFFLRSEWSFDEHKYTLKHLPNMSAISDGAPWFPGALSGRLPHLLVKFAPAYMISCVIALCMLICSTFQTTLIPFSLKPAACHCNSLITYCSDLVSITCLLVWPCSNSLLLHCLGEWAVSKSHLL